MENNELIVGELYSDIQDYTEERASILRFVGFEDDDEPSPSAMFEYHSGSYSYAPYCGNIIFTKDIQRISPFYHVTIEQLIECGKITKE